MVDGLGRQINLTPTPEPMAHLEIRDGNDLRRVRVGMRQDDALVWLTPELT